MNNRFEFYRMNNYKYCKHDPIWDHSTGSEVCLNCGLVLCEGLTYNELHLQHHGGEMPNVEDASLNHLHVEGVDNVPDFIRKVGDRMNLSRGSIENSILKFKSLRDRCKEINFGGPRKSKKIRSNINLAAFSIYDTLRDELHPRTLKEICVAANIGKVGDVWKLEKQFGQKKQELPQKPLSAKDLIFGYYTFLDLDYNDAKTILEMAEFVQKLYGECSFMPTTVASALMYIYINKIKGKKCSLQRIAQMYHTSTMSISRFIKRNPTLAEHFTNYNEAHEHY